MRVLISGGNSDNTTMPTSQNQLVTIAPHHSRESARRRWIIATVEVAILAEIFKFGAPSPVAGIKLADNQQAIAKPTTSAAKRVWLLSPCAASPPAMVPKRMATKVAPSTSALPIGSCS